MCLYGSSGGSATRKDSTTSWFHCEGPDKNVSELNRLLRTVELSSSAYFSLEHRWMVVSSIVSSLASHLLDGSGSISVDFCPPARSRAPFKETKKKS